MRELPRHKPCGTRVIVASKIADDLEPAIVFWCPTCDTATTPDENDPPRGIDFDDVTTTALGEHIALLNGLDLG